MTTKVHINGIWKEIGKDLTWEEYEEYCEAQDEKYSNKKASELGIDRFHFQVLDLERRADSDTIILRFPDEETLEEFIEENKDDQWNCSIKVLDITLNLLKVCLF